MKDIPGYEGLYAATEDGQIWSHRRQNFLKQSANSEGYLVINLYKDKNKKNCTVHRLIALTYIPNPDNLPEVDHIDRDRLNNSIANLRWVTHKENMLNKDWEQICEKKREVFFNMPEEIRKERTRKAAQVCSRAVEMRNKNNHDIIIKTFSSCRQAAVQEFGDERKRSNINKCAHGELKSAYGYFWTFAPADVIPE